MKKSLEKQPTRRCPKCGQDKYFEDFYHQNSRPHGYCKPCAKGAEKSRHKAKVIDLFGKDEWKRREALRRRKATVKKGYRLCAVCLEEKKEVEFYSSKAGDVDCYCKPCRLAWDKKRNARSPRSRLSTLLGAARTRAANNDWDFDLTLDGLEGLWKDQKGKCWYTGVVLTYDGTRREEAVSIDRVNSELGYTLDNVVLCCRRVNEMKREMSYAALVEWCRKIINTRRNRHGKPV